MAPTHLFSELLVLSGREPLYVKKKEYKGFLDHNYGLSLQHSFLTWWYHKCVTFIHHLCVNFCVCVCVVAEPHGVKSQFCYILQIFWAWQVAELTRWLEYIQGKKNSACKKRMGNCHVVVSSPYQKRSIGESGLSWWSGRWLVTAQGSSLM